MKDSELRQALEEIRAALGDLAARVASLEAPQAPAASAITEDLVLVITAAVAAFLGERAHVRQIRLISSSAWAQQGRVSVQASHRLAR